MDLVELEATESDDERDAEENDDVSCRYCRIFCDLCVYMVRIYYV